MPYKPQQNGIAKRRNRTLIEMTRSMMAFAYLSIHFWGEALSTSAYILNRVKTKSKTLTHEIWTGLKLNLENLKVWGCRAHVLIQKLLRDKLKDKTWECKFIGYVENGNGYRFYNSEKGLIESKDVFLENSEQITPMENIRLLKGEEFIQENSDQITPIKDITTSEDEESVPPDYMESSFEDKNITNPHNSGSKRRWDPNSYNH